MLPCGKSLSTLIQFKNTPLKFGILLALAAWLMQLSVFLTPIFAKQISLGFGVCEELAVFSQFTVTSTASSSSHGSTHSQHQLFSETTASSTIAASKVDTPNLPQHQVEPHHQNHAKCEFCLLLGHSVLPPLYVVLAVLLPIAISKITVQAKVADVVFLKQNKNLRPQGRAPPQFTA